MKQIFGIFVAGAGVSLVTATLNAIFTGDLWVTLVLLGLGILDLVGVVFAMKNRKE